MGVQEFKCPGCGAKLKWDAAEQKMKCDYCDNTYDIATLEEFEQEENSAPVEEYAWDPYNAPGEVTGLKTYICQSCGGAITVSDDSAATSCPYCDSPVVLNNNVTGMLQPDLIIPFTKTGGTECSAEVLQGQASASAYVCFRAPYRGDKGSVRSVLAL